MNKWTDIINVIKGSDDIVIMTHTNMDGDAIGSASALCHALRQLGKRCVILLEDQIPGYLKFMHGHEGRGNQMPFFVFTMPYKADLAIAVDCGEATRIEKRLDVFNSCKTRICVDHHVPTGGFADYSVVEPQASATGLLIMELIKELQVPFSKEIAEDLYIAILTDTGCFKFSNTTPESFTAAAELLTYGIDPEYLSKLLYETIPVPQMRLEAKIIDWMELFADGKAVISCVSMDQLKELGATYDMTGNCIDILRKIEGTELCAVLKEHYDGNIRLSLRSKGAASARSIAVALGGGGHEKASGGTLYCSMDEARDKVKAEMLKELERCKII